MVDVTTLEQTDPKHGQPKSKFCSQQRTLFQPNRLACPEMNFRVRSLASGIFQEL